MVFFVDYAIAKTCRYLTADDLCRKCGSCGREFDDNGIMIDLGGTESVDLKEEIEW